MKSIEDASIKALKRSILKIYQKGFGEGEERDENI
jgi:hypothetical protein